ncbi:unnamed protein product [Rotaria magnacalcarata]|uniref:Novel toxin 16 domain-containing protein n=1 Tax=Rotaria magnacalcarata TaxID=392030 RepID=A0A816N7I7_9BILA|nr:unnamed protein product [Rotaria magnacalcarata]CAF2086216.1 unnamed protein product [Rotaria magnacalcarata]CAF3948415.1 unnamed protein product [Rotaria magnacalcarata]CAF4147389.1 unnamed protein product [Rotaria magnacalcarata]
MSPSCFVLSFCFVVLFDVQSIISQQLETEFERQIFESRAASEPKCVASNPLLKCPVPMCLALQNEVNKYKGDPGCKGTDSLEVLKQKLARTVLQRIARLNIMNKCFGGGDSEHKAHLDQVRATETNCAKFMGKL